MNPRIALVGHPNCGKTTLFNSLTGGSQHVGNYSGVTVERHVGAFTHAGTRYEATDLPGTYSLCASSADEAVVQQTLLSEPFDLIVNVIDSTHLNRNLYLSLQLFTTGFPVLLVLNMTDEAEGKGLLIDADRLTALTGLPVVKTVGRTGKGIAELRAAIATACAVPPRTRIPDWDHQGDSHLRAAVTRLAAIFRQLPPLFPANPQPEWLAIKLLERDEIIMQAVKALSDPLAHTLIAATEEESAKITRIEGETPDVAIADFRYGITNALCRECLRQIARPRQNLTAWIDRVATHRILGLPIFFLLMYGMFALTFTASEPLMGLMEGGFAWLGNALHAAWPDGRWPHLESLLIDGMLGGTAGVLVFLPNILVLFLCLALIEGTGYMARAAFIMDRAMQSVGLHGKSFIPLLVGFGCTVPAILATRTIESRRDRMATLFIAPLMSCGARLPIYTLIIPAFFPPAWRATALISIYTLGVLLALLLAFVLRRTVFRGAASPFILELPPYRLPTARSILLHMWERARLYVQKAGTLILAASVLLWAASTYPQKTSFSQDYDAQIAHLQATGQPDAADQILQAQQEKQAERMAYTVSGRLGRTLEPILRPLGFDWRIGSALVGAFAAKEVFVSQLAILNAVDESGDGASLRSVLASRYTPLQAYALMLFCLIATPCVATFAVVRRETGSWRWPFAQQIGLTLLAYIVTLTVYQGGRLLTAWIG